MSGEVNQSLPSILLVHGGAGGRVQVVEDMTALKDELGIEGVFSSTSLASGEQWRFQTHLANLPIYYEYKDKDGNDIKID